MLTGPDGLIRIVIFAVAHYALTFARGALLDVATLLVTLADFGSTVRAGWIGKIHYTDRVALAGTRMEEVVYCQ